MKENQLIQLVEEMTIDEKINQLLQLAAAFYSDKAEEKTGPMSELGLSQETIDTAGTTLGVSGANEAKRVQRIYAKSSIKYSNTFNGGYYSWFQNYLSDSFGFRKHLG